MKETFWFEFDMAELYGEENIRELAAAAFDKWKVEPVILTDLVMVINHKSWDHYDKRNDKLSSLYADLYYEYYEKAINYLESKGNEDDLNYFFRTLD